MLQAGGVNGCDERGRAAARQPLYQTKAHAPFVAAVPSAEPDAGWNLVTHLIESEIAAHVLTEGHAGDAAQVPALLGLAEGVIASVTADGAYDGEPTCAAAAARQRHPPPEVIVPPRATAKPVSVRAA
jgi:hypothetical protein